MFNFFAKYAFIDNQKVKITPGMTILEAAKSVDIHIPTLCHVSGCTPNGVCRICVVELADSGRLVAACHTPILEGMVIRTRTNSVIETRKTIVELMLMAHSTNCVNDTNAANCALHNLASDFEVGAPRFFTVRPRRFDIEEYSPIIGRNLSKCILCRKCVTACREIAGKNIMDIGYRGFDSKIITGCDEPMLADICSDCGICVAHCPTGALFRPDGGEAVLTEATEPTGTNAMQKNRLNLLPDLKRELDTSGRLSREEMSRVAGKLDLTLSEVYGTASFYSYLPRQKTGQFHIRLCGCVPCDMAGGLNLATWLEQDLDLKPGDVSSDGLFSLELVSCIGACDQSPAMLVNDHLYTNLTEQSLPLIINEMRQGNLPDSSTKASVAFGRQIVMKHCGKIDSSDLSSYINEGGFKAFEKVRNRMKPATIIDEIKRSGLTGRGGAGFSCGAKWDMARNVRTDCKFIICNADEGEVGTFKDRYLLMHDPFSLLEGICIAGLAVGAEKAYIYLREEYHYLIDTLQAAIDQVRDKGYLKQTEIELFEGAGAYVCGEESALMNSIEGLRGESRYKPPFPTDRGLWNRPTVINNVETLMNVPRIIEAGSNWFAGTGTERSRGTKVFSVSGDTPKPGVYELTMGSSLKQLVMELAGAENILAVQVGGAAGPIIPESKIDIPLSHETVLGSGSVMVFNRDRDIVDIVRNNIRFLHEESCGKCTPCRDGLEAMTEIFSRITSGRGVETDIRRLEELAAVMKRTSICGLGQAAGTPVTTSLAHFRETYEIRIRQSAFLRNYTGTGYLKTSIGG